MTTKRHLMIAGALAVCFGARIAQAGLGLGQSSDFWDLYFDGNGDGEIYIFNTSFGPTVSSAVNTGFIAADPDQGNVNAVTFLLPGNIGSGVVDIYSPANVLNGAIDFYNIGANGYMAEYANTGGQLDETINSGFVPVPGYNINENALGQFVWYSGGSYRANNDYYGTIDSSQLISTPDGGLTLGMLGAAFTLLSVVRRKLGN
jgi:hypothetical protein